MHYLQVVIFVTFVACVHGVVNIEEPDQVNNLEKSQRIVLNGDGNISKTRHDINEIEDEERWKFPGASRLMSYFQKQPDVVKVLKENPALARTLSNNPALAKSFQNNPQFSKTFQVVQKDMSLMNRIKSFEKDPAASKLKTALGKHPSGLTETSVAKIGSIVTKSSPRQDVEILLAFGLVFLVLFSVQAMVWNE